MSGYYNLGSLILGLIAWGVPAVTILQYRKTKSRNCSKVYLLSFGACLVSLCLQFFEINHRVKIEDWSALMDTSDILIIVCKE